MSEVRLTEHDPETSTMKPVTAVLISDLENNPLTVSYQDGSIEELCLTNPESDKTLNIKRGILSLLQNNMDDINADQTVTEVSIHIPFRFYTNTKVTQRLNTLNTTSLTLTPYKEFCCEEITQKEHRYVMYSH